MPENGHWRQPHAPDFQVQIPVLATLVYWGVPATPALLTPTFPDNAGLLASEQKYVKSFSLTGKTETNLEATWPAWQAHTLCHSWQLSWRWWLAWWLCQCVRLLRNCWVPHIGRRDHRRPWQRPAVRGRRTLSWCPPGLRWWLTLQQGRHYRNENFRKLSR